MANVFAVNAYQINQNVLASGASQRIGFSTTRVLLRDCSASPTRSLSSGVSVYGVIQMPNGDQFYTQETLSALITLVG